MLLEFRPKLDKIVELLLYLSRARPNADKYQAVKFFYLADKEHLIRHGRPITSEMYFALKFGPVASSAMDFLNSDEITMKQAGIESLPFRTEVVQVAGKPITYIREPFRDVDFSLFSKSDILVFDEVIKLHGNLTFDQLFELTHSHYAYTRAWNNRKYGSNRSEMRYEDMIEDKTRRDEIVRDIAPIAAHME